MVDEIGRRLIAQRNGLNAAPALQVNQVLASMQTNAQARGVLGITAKWLSQAYGVLETFPFLSGKAKDQARDLLDRNNTFAQKVYATIPDDAAPVSIPLRKSVTTAAKQSASSLKLVSSAAANLNQGYVDDLADYLAGRASQFVQNQLERLTGKKLDINIPSALPKTIIWIGIGTVVVVGLILLTKIVRTAVLHGSELEEAEREAMAIADAQRHKKASRKVYSIA